MYKTGYRVWLTLPLAPLVDEEVEGKGVCIPTDAIEGVMDSRTDEGVVCIFTRHNVFDVLGTRDEIMAMVAPESGEEDG